MKLAREYGSIYWLDMLGKPVVIVSGFDLVDELCDESRFDKSVRGALRRLRDFAGDGLFTAYTQEPNWSRAHNILLPSFAQRAMQGYHPMMLDIAEQLVLKWDRLNADDEIDVTHDMTSLTLDTIGLCGFGYRFNSFYRESPHPFVGAMIGALGTSMETRGSTAGEHDQEGPRAEAPRRHQVHERDGGPHRARAPGERRRPRRQARSPEPHALRGGPEDRASGSTTSTSATRSSRSSSPGTRPRAGSCPSPSTTSSTIPTCSPAPTPRWIACSGPIPRVSPTYQPGEPARLHRADPEGVAPALAHRAGVRAVAVQGRDDRRQCTGCGRTTRSWC